MQVLISYCFEMMFYEISTMFCGDVVEQGLYKK